jgi:DNA-binding PadR family transcriptional regulator
MARMKEPVYWILCALADGEAHGYAIARRVADLTGGQTTVGPGTLYATLERLVAEGLIEEASSEIVDGRHRRNYRLAGSGRRLVIEETETRNAALLRARLALGMDPA